MLISDIVRPSDRRKGWQIHGEACPNLTRLRNYLKAGISLWVFKASHTSLCQTAPLRQIFTERIGYYKLKKKKKLENWKIVLVLWLKKKKKGLAVSGNSEPDAVP